MNLDQHMHTSTHTHGHTLDLVITRSSEAIVRNINVHAPVMSDHNPVTFLVQTRKPPPMKKLVSFRKIKDINIDQFKSDIMRSSLVETPSDDVDQLVNQYHSTLSTILDDHAPVVTKVMVDRSNCPWFNDEILQAKKKRRKAERKWHSSKLHVHLDILRNERVRFNALCKKAKAEHYRSKINDCAKDQKLLFQLTNELMHRGRDISLPTFQDPQALADDFINFFTDKVDKISQSFSRSPVLNSPPCNTTVPALSHFQPVTEDDVKKVILSGNSKTCHLDPIPTKLLKQCINELLPCLTKIVNDSLGCSKFPTRLKFATLVPLLKKPSLDREQHKHYRPVSNLEYLGKLIEKASVRQLTDHRTENGMHALHQSAYRKHHSTETALIKIVNDVLNAMDGRKCVALAMLDLSAAFDTVSHDILLRRLEEDSGVQGAALLWMQSYFEGRSQAVIINDITSVHLPLSTGMPQGSCIGPNEFPPYTAPVFAIAERHGVQMHVYADDTQLYIPFAVEDYKDAIARLEGCIADIRIWLAANHLKLNDDKTEFIIFGHSNLTKKISGSKSIVIGDATISASATVRNIGAVLDDQLSMKEHIKYIARSCYMYLRMLGQIRQNLTEDSAATLVHAFISSKLDCMNSLLVGIPEYVVKKLQLIQNNAARIVLRKNKYDHVTPLLKKLHWLPIASRIQYKICLQTYKALHGQAPPYISSLITRYEPTRSLRSAGRCLLQIKVPCLHRTGGRSFEVCAPQMWNSLPVDLRTCDTLESFKAGLKTHLFRKAYGE